MDKQTKDTILESRKAEVEAARLGVVSAQEEAERIFRRDPKDIARMSMEEQQVYVKLYEMGVERKGELRSMFGNPFFSRLHISFPDKHPSLFYIGKFSLPESRIYSWVTPIATLRFEDPGEVSYELPNKKRKYANLHDKESFMIAGGDISYLSREDCEYGKTLIYQKHFSEQLGEFGLSEIVSSMEKNQDTVIRAEAKGPFLISGPAGSGKTTVALHRIAFLNQSPETAEIYKGKTCAVFVQDRGTKDYFTKLLPDLGIHDVTIYTFDEWALNILNFDTLYTFVERFGKNFDEKNEYEYLKVQSIQNLPEKVVSYTNPFRILKSAYSEMPKKYLELLSKQESVGILDKQDLTLLLSVYLKSKGSLEEVQVYYTKKPDGTSERKTRRVAIMYSCILVDEFQNYTPIQLALIRSVLSEKTESIIYVGDLNQQTHIGSIQNWDEIREHFPSHRKVVLEKVYRNDPAILRFLMKVGYRVDEKLLDRPEKGKAEFVSGNALFVLKKYALENEKRHIGILAFEDMELEIFKDKFSESENVHPMTISEAQGLEFDTVFIVGISESLFTHHADGILGDAYKNAYADTVTDYLYVACTRPKKDLFLCADPSLEKPLAEFVKESKGRRGS